MAYEILTKAVMIVPVGEPIFSELSTTVELEDDGAGLFVVVTQEAREGTGKISLCPEEWPMIRKSIDTMLALCVKRVAQP